MLKFPYSGTPMYDLHRPRADGGFDAISIVLDKDKRPEFYAIINRIPQEGLKQPWGEFVPADQAGAAAPQTRVVVRKLREGITAKLFPFCFKHTAFGFSPRATQEENCASAERACAAFIDVLQQAEDWWARGELGTNLTFTELRVLAKGSEAAASSCKIS